MVIRRLKLFFAMAFLLILTATATNVVAGLYPGNTLLEEVSGIEDASDEKLHVK